MNQDERKTKLFWYHEEDGGNSMSDYFHTYNLMDNAKIFMGYLDEMVDTFFERWPEGESYWLPLVQTLQFNEIQVPKHLEADFAGVDYQEFLTQINYSVGELRKSCELFLGSPFRFPKLQVKRFEEH
ncbi:hypothetical protein SAMN00768000_0301 [Sulfobacillus thermosulfidooxidans DSM 9293]|uniref:Uncharacterized protein n=1 Tax=Sulfobacillus thermosulfidooxidans (strain DSM 9293 / VKM B-1269 / AT-1) TaxID=929705 RepID=A0A1W1W7Q8_SULTA|nr:hypothetical protein [Sulfobacillus thermosulfidooxidans]SMC02090.1 hypothetical protein SAMN00768000_0301 [Sulfobacillus thermosulfidooxidans DSM 9293]